MTAIVLLPQRIVVRKDAPADPPRATVPTVTGTLGVTAGASRRVRRAVAAEPDLPRRSPQANLAPQLKDAPPGQSAVAGGPPRPDARSAEQARALIASIRQGWRSGSTGTDGPEPDHDANNDGTQS
jgi:hypothetical protein